MASDPLLRGTLADCSKERHVAPRHYDIDASGVQTCRCKVCGCNLRRLPAMRQWFRSGMMG